MRKSLRDPARRPTHPGAVLREDVLPALGMTQGDFAAALGVSRLTVSEILHERRGLSAEMSLRLATLLRTTPESWLRMQEAVRRHSTPTECPPYGLTPNPGFTSP